MNSMFQKNRLIINFVERGWGLKFVYTEYTETYQKVLISSHKKI